MSDGKRRGAPGKEIPRPGKSGATVFICGALVMVLEMTGARVLAPHVGTSAIVWTSLIGVVLAFLAAGAYAGGRFADKKLSARGLCRILTGGALGCMLTAFCNNSIGAGITAHVGNLYVAAVLAAICIFALPAFFFGMITPYIIRLRIASVDTAGETVGQLYALSTAGSILGTFLGGFILISWFGSSTILWGVAVCLVLLSLAYWPGRPWGRLGLLAICLFLAWQDMGYAQWLAEKGGPRLIESPYNSIRVMEGLDPARGGARVRLMATDPGYTQSGMLLADPDELYFPYTRFYAMGPRLTPDARKVLMLGGGGYSVPKWLLSGKSGLNSPDLQITAVEIDPAMTAAAEKYFALPRDGRLRVLHEDARSFLNRQTDQYDLVFVDVFNSHYSVPFQMGTREAAANLARAVAPGGTMIMNIISAVRGEDGRLFRAIWQNLAAIFPEISVYCVGNPGAPEEIQNLMVVARKALPDGSLAAARTPCRGASPGQDEIARMETHRYLGDIPPDVPPLTDDYAPVERYTLMLAR